MLLLFLWKRSAGILSVFLFSFTLCHGQENFTLSDLFKRIDLDISGGGYYQRPNTQSLRHAVLLPTYIREMRQVENPVFNSSWNKGTDNPLFHGAYFLSLDTRFRVTDHLTLQSSFIGEMRGFSYGVNNTRNTTVFPQVTLEFNRSFRIFNDTFAFSGSIGNQVNPRLYEGLTIYNMYQHGIDLSFGWRRLRLRYFQLSDLMNGIGLATGDSYDYILSYENPGNDKPLLKLQAGYSSYPFYQAAHRGIVNFSASLSPRTGQRFYLQAGYRPGNRSLFAFEEMVGLVAGVSRKVSRVRFTSELTGEGRYYGVGFNSGFKNTNVFYRDPSAGAYANTIGANLYPLLLYERPFSQWAVYSEYQRSIIAGVLRINSSYTIYKGIFTGAGLDLNYISAESLRPFLYRFYHLYFGWREDRNMIVAGITNKSMNLDLHYPTFYQLRDPVLMITLKRAFR